jgi:hypothetical protein
MTDSDEDLSFSSIHDLDHAPEPPSHLVGVPGSVASRSYSPRGHAARPPPSAGSHHMLPTRRHSAGIILPDHPSMAGGVHQHHSLLVDQYQYGAQSPGGGSITSGSGIGTGGAAMMPMAPQGRHRSASMNMYLLPTHQQSHHRDRANSDSYNGDGSFGSIGSQQLQYGGGGGTPGMQRTRRTVGFLGDEQNLMRFPSHEDDSSYSLEQVGGGSGGGGTPDGDATTSAAAAAATAHYGDSSSNSMNESARRLQLEKERLDSLDDSSVNIDDGEEQYVSEGDDFGDSQATQATPTIFLGFQVPRHCAWRPDMHKIATFVVTRAPCFCCLGFRQPTDRAILARLNVLVAFFAIVQLASLTFLAVVTFSPNLVDRTLETQTDAEQAASEQETPAKAITTAWTLNGYIYMLGILAFVMLNASICTVRIIQNVNLVGAIRYL